MPKTKEPNENEFFEMLTEETNGAKTRKKPVPQIAERITAGAIKLPLSDRVIHLKKVQESITEELKQKQLDLDEATRIVNGVKD